jgi:hypothetical protein
MTHLKTKSKWSPTGKPVAPSSTLVARNPEQEPPAKAGARVEGSDQSGDRNEAFESKIFVDNGQAS